MNNLLTNFNTITNILINPDGTIDVKNLKEGMFISEIRAWEKKDYDEVEGVYVYHKTHYKWLNCRITELIKYNERSPDGIIHIMWECSTFLEDGVILKRTNKKYWYWVYYPTENNGSGDDYIKFYP